MVNEINEKLESILNSTDFSVNELLEAKRIFNDGFCQVLTRSKKGIDILVQTNLEEDEQEITLRLHETELRCFINK